MSLDKKARLRSRAFLNQAREYFTAVGGLSPVAKPLVAYYFMLNLTKAFLTASDPSLTVSHHLRHGMTQAYEPGTNYSFNREAFRIKQAGVFRYLAEKTGMGHCWANNYELTLRELMPYLPDAYMLYADAYARTPRLLPVDDVSVLFHGRTAWLRGEVKPEVLKQHELSAPRLLEQAGVFGAHFKWVHTDRKETVTYESIQPLTFGHRRSEVLPKLSEEFDRCLFATDRSFSRVTPVHRSVETNAAPVTRGGDVRGDAPPLERRAISGPRTLSGFSSANTPGYSQAGWTARLESFLLNLATRVTREEHIIA